MFRRLFLAAMAALAVMGVSAPCLAAGGLTVSPVMLEMQSGGRAQTLQVSNPGDEEISVQLRLFRWTTNVEGDVLEPSRDILFSPPIFSLKGGATQIVRFAPPAQVDREVPYRLFVDQLPDLAQPGLQMPVRMVLPLFVEPPGAKASQPSPEAADLVWKVRFDPARREALLTVENRGARRVRLVNLTYSAPQASGTVRSGLVGYALPGQMRGWSFPFPGRPGEVTVRAETEAGPLSARAEVTP